MEILTEKGIVIERIGNRIKIEIPKKPECEDCRSIFCSKSDDRNNLFEIETNADFSTGDNVLVQLPGKNLIKATFILFILPLILFIATIVGVINYIPNPLVATISGLGLVSIYFLIIRKSRFLEIQPQIIKES